MGHQSGGLYLSKPGWIVSFSFFLSLIFPYMPGANAAPGDEFIRQQQDHLEQQRLEREEKRERHTVIPTEQVAPATPLKRTMTSALTLNPLGYLVLALSLRMISSNC